MWNLLSIVREMYRRNDRNGIPLLEIITQQCLDTVQVYRGSRFDWPLLSVERLA